MFDLAPSQYPKIRPKSEQLTFIEGCIHIVAHHCTFYGTALVQGNRAERISPASLLL